MDPKKILGVSSDATPAEIHRAYRKQARKHHPDRGGDVWAFQQVQQAFEQLTNTTAASPNQRRGTGTKPDKGSSRSSGSSDRPSRAHSKAPPHQFESESEPSRREKFHNPAKARKRPNGTLQWKKLFGNDLPLQTETSAFILLNCLDVFMTYILLTKPQAFESNPVANYFLQNFGFNGMVAFKLVIVAVVCIIAQIAALKNLRLGQCLLVAGSLVVGYVVVYSARLYVSHFL